MEQQKQKWWEMQWPRRHALAFPFGATAATALLGRGDIRHQAAAVAW